MHLTVTQWRSPVPVAQKSEVSEIAGSASLETGEKKNIKYICCVCADAHFTMKFFKFVQLCSYNTIAQCSQNM